MCPNDGEQDLTEYHIVNRKSCGINDKQLHQELLQSAKEFTSLAQVLTYELAKEDRNKLRGDTTISAIDTEGLADDEVIAALSK